MAHAYLSPSASHRWLHCTAAPELESTVEDQSSVFAEEGTLAHAICEAKLHEFLVGREASEGKITPSAKDLFREEFGIDWTEHELYQEEMEDTSQYYADAVIRSYIEALKQTPDAKLLVEQKLSIMPQLFGTVDAMIIQDGVLEVFDYKHGKGVKVSAKQNPQMMIYAVAAWLEYSDFFRIESVKMTIVQPRVYNTNTWELSEADLAAWNTDVLMPTVVHILEGKDLKQEPGEWCKFCKVKKSCKALASSAVDISSRHPDPRLLTIEEVASLLRQVETIKSWCETLSGYALELALEGNSLPGYKVVEGRSKRIISDEEGLVTALKDAGIDEEKIYKQRELQSLTSIEKLVGKKNFSAFDKYITKAAGKPAIVEDSDSRPAYAKKTVEDDFAGIELGKD